MNSVTIAHFAEEIRANAALKRLAKSTLRQKKQILRELTQLTRADGSPLVAKTTDLTQATIGAWFSAHPERTANTLKSHLRALRAMTGRARRLGWLRVDPFDLDEVKALVRDDSRPKAPRRRWSKSPEDVRRLFAQADLEAKRGSWRAARTRAYVYTLFLTGWRPGEVEHLDVADFSPAFRTLEIRAKWIVGRGGRRTWWRPKSPGTSGVNPIGERLSRVLQDWLVRRPRHPRRNDACMALFPGERWMGHWTGGSKTRPLDVLQALGRRAGVGEVWRKSARKGIGTHGKLIGLESLERTGMFHHAAQATSECYDDERVESLRPAVAKVERFYLHG